MSEILCGILGSIVAHYLILYVFPLIGALLIFVWVNHKETIWKATLSGLVCYTCLLVISNIWMSNYKELSKQPQEHIWTLTAINPIGKALDTSQLRRGLDVEIKGSWGAGTLTIEGSSNGKNYFKLRDIVNNIEPISIARQDPATPIVLLEHLKYIRPVLTGADGRDSIVVTISGRN